MARGCSIEGALRRALVWFALAAWLGACAAAWASPWQVTVTAEPTRVVLGSDSFSTIAVEVRDQAGQPARDGTEVHFVTSLGTILPSAQTVNGVARTTLRSAVGGIADVTVLVGSDSATVQVEFIAAGAKAPEQPRMVRITGGYVAYSLEQQVVVAADRARLEHGSITIEAAGIQYDLAYGAVRAQHGVQVSNGTVTLEGERLSYGITDGRGILLRANPDVEKLFFQGSNLEVYARQGPIPGRAFEPVDTDSTRSWVVAREIVVFPREKVQFIRAEIYMGADRLLALPYHQIPLRSYHSQQGFVNQVVSFTSAGGINVDFPVYFEVKEHRSGALRIRRSSYPGFGGVGSSGWSLGVEEEYSLGDMDGLIAVDNITGSAKGLRWEHHHDFGQTRADLSFRRYRYDSRYPAVSYGTAFLRRSLGGAELSVMGNTSSYGGSSSWSLDTGLRWPYRPIGNSKWRYDLGSHVRVGDRISAGYLGVSAAGGVRTAVTVDLGVHSPDFSAGRKTSLNADFLTRVGFMPGGSNQSVEARLTARRRLFSQSNVSLTYSQTLGGQDYWSFGRKRLSGNLYLDEGKGWSSYGFLSYDLDASSSFASLGATYDLPFERREDGTARWRMEGRIGTSCFAGNSVTDSRISLSRDIGDYSVSLVYSPSGADAYSPYGGGFGFNRGKHLWIEIGMGDLGF